LIIEIAVILSIVLMVDINTGRSKGIIRYLIFFTLGMPFILLAGWYLSGGETSPINDAQLLQATILLGLGFVFWLAIFPFHSWIPVIMEESEIQDSLYVLTVLPFSIFIIFMKYLNGFVWLRDYEAVYKALLLVGIIMVLAGSIWAIFQKPIRKMIGYLTINFTGYLLIAIGLNTNEGFILFSQLQLPRLLSYLLLTVSLISLERDLNLENISDLRSVFYYHHFASSGLVVSFFTLVGLPLSAGFLPLQMLYQAAARENVTISAFMLVGSGLLTVFFIRLFLDIIHPVEDDYEIVESKEFLIEKILIGLLIILIILIGIFPNSFYSQFDQLMNSFEFLIK
jgi:multicomponent Na+:H+ antiporter subunit D